MSLLEYIVGFILGAAFTLIAYKKGPRGDCGPRGDHGPTGAPGRDGRDA